MTKLDDVGGGGCDRSFSFLFFNLISSSLLLFMVGCEELKIMEDDEWEEVEVDEMVDISNPSNVKNDE